MTGLICYDSKYGSTKTVCNWIKRGFTAHCADIKKVSEIVDLNYDFYIVGSPVFIGKPMQSVVDFINGNKLALSGKPLVLFITSWAESTPYNKECLKFIDLLRYYILPCRPILVKSLPGKLIMSKISDNDRRIMGKLLRRIDSMSVEFDSRSIQWKDNRNRKLCYAFAKEIEAVLAGVESGCE